MKINLTELEYCKYNVVYESDVQEVLDKRGKVLESFKRAPIKGFRQGKAPLEVISRIYKNQIDDAVKKALLEEAYHNTIFDKNLKVYGPPTFNSGLLLGNSFNCEFTVHTKPDFELASFHGMELPKPHEEISSTELTEKILQELRVKHGDSAPYTEEDFIQKGDNIIIDYEGFLDGEKLENISAQGEMMKVGGGGQLVEFENNLLGMTLGETREFSMTLPENSLPSIAGKTVQMKVSLSMGSKNVPCALDDNLAKKMNKENFEQLREFVTQTATAQVTNNFKIKLQNAICSRLLSDNKLQVPQYLALSEARYLSQQANLNWESLSNEDKEKYLEVGTNNVKLSLILDKIREEYPEANLTDQEIFEIVKTNIVNNNISSDVDKVMKELIEKNMIQVIFARVKDNNTLDYLTSKVRIVE